ncbi:MAG: ABC transporter permease [Lachnospiraceae bacterium]|nr:ABC transporter permease [Lachnospiraceae bacterium]
MGLLISALSQGMLYAPMALGVFIAFRILNTPDLTIDGSLVLGMCVCAVVTISGHPYLALVCGLLAGALAGLVTGILQTSLKIHPILSGVLTMTGLYTINYMILGGQSNLYLQSLSANESGSSVQVASNTLYKTFYNFLCTAFNTTELDANLSVLIISTVLIGIAAILLCVFFKTRTGIAIRATGDNEEMVRSSSINADASRILGIMLSNALVAFSGALLCQQQRYADLNCGNGMLVVGLASVIIGQIFLGKRNVTLGVFSAILGSLAYRIILQAAYQADMPSYGVKLLSAIIVVIALILPLIKNKIIEYRLAADADKED